MAPMDHSLLHPLTPKTAAEQGAVGGLSRIGITVCDQDTGVMVCILLA